ncbi:MAG: hypothetical protein KTR15_09425 [Phycisphaeraceae bacterium]|nr:hypothetical protein [Phycisphaeraceae bacterium]
MKTARVKAGLTFCTLLIMVSGLLGCGDSGPSEVSESEEVVFVYQRDMDKPITSLSAPSKVEHTLTDEQARQFIALINNSPSITGEKAKMGYITTWHRNYFEVAGRKYAVTSSSVYYRGEDKNTFGWSHPLLKTMTNLTAPDTTEDSLKGMASHDWHTK